MKLLSHFSRPESWDERKNQNRWRRIRCFSVLQIILRFYPKMQQPRQKKTNCNKSNMKWRKQVLPTNKRTPSKTVKHLIASKFPKKSKRKIAKIAKCPFQDYIQHPSFPLEKIVKVIELIKMDKLTDRQLHKAKQNNG